MLSFWCNYFWLIQCRMCYHFRLDYLDLIQSRCYHFRRGNLRKLNEFGRNYFSLIRGSLIWVNGSFLKGLIKLILNFVLHRVEIDLRTAFDFSLFVASLLLWTPVLDCSLSDLLFIFRRWLATALWGGLFRWWRWFRRRRKFKDSAFAQVLLRFFKNLSSIIWFRFNFLFLYRYNLLWLFHSKQVRYIIILRIN